MANRRNIIGAAAGLLLIGSANFAPAAAKTSRAAGASTPAQEAHNLALVLRFSELAFNQHDTDAAGAMLAEDYIQHNPRMASGRAAFLGFIRATAAARPNFKSVILRSAAGGDLVWTHVKLSDGSGKGDIALVNIFRVANGKIVEHWDVVQPVPETSANTNTMF